MVETNQRYNMGVIHGRFQVLHNDHLKYLLEGKALCKHLIVGITNPDPSQVKDEPTNTHRSTLRANPLTYFERYRMVLAALTEVGYGLNDFSVVPMPISSPGYYKYYVPMRAVFFLSIYDDWGRQKKKYFESLKLNVHVIRDVGPEEKGISGSEVRRRMAEGLPWEHLVPGSVVSLLYKWEIPQRLSSLKL